MKVSVGFEAQVHNRLDSVLLEGFYILASLLAPSSGVGTPQMWMQARHKQAEGLQLEPHSSSVEQFLEVHSSIVVLPRAHHSLFEELSLEPHSWFGEMSAEPRSLFGGLSGEPRSLFEGLSGEPHSLFEGLSGEPRSLDVSADQLQSSHPLH